GTVVPAREVKPPCNCRMKCSEKYTAEIRRKLLQNLLRLNFQSQTQFLANHIEVKYTARPQKVNSRRKYTRMYKLSSFGRSTKLCKRMFQNTFDIGSRKIRDMAAKIIAGSGVASDDGRQNNSNRHPISQDHLEFIRKQIMSFPAYSSHYSREKSDKLYLSSDLNICRIYELYQEQCAKENIIPVHYRLVFKSMNLSFRKPKVDTCGKCDRLTMEIKLEMDLVKKGELQQLLDCHQIAADKVYKEKTKDVALAKIDATLRTSSFDLQKQLPTPYLSNGEAFYCRQLYTYNLTIFSTYAGENSAYCYLWDETKARRGSQEIGSCLLQDLNKLPSSVETMIHYSDRCFGQNNNKTIIFLFPHFIEECVKHGRKLNIYHKLMATGHSHMEVDTVHGAIEKAKKCTTMNIEVPHHWALLISGIRRKVPFNVIEMEQRDMLNLKSLDQRYRIPKMSLNNKPFRIKNTMVFYFSTEFPGHVQFKEQVTDEQFDRIQILPDVEVLENVELRPITNIPLELSSVKLD
ncbi:uncharacterized protein LOC129717309, partial [Wyeomyia smithii]|uniref:uncharacterized protein LOC129717309 n=1 Tax=Wyeomyia smithii TaxID=174621 RepID=UPI002467EECC